MSLSPFWPGASSTINASTITGSVALARMGPRIRICNTGSNAVFVNFGDFSVTATVAGGLPILPGTAELFTLAQIRTGAGGGGQPTHFAAITETGTSRVSVTVGEGDS